MQYKGYNYILCHSYIQQPQQLTGRSETFTKLLYSSNPLNQWFSIILQAVIKGPKVHYGLGLQSQKRHVPLKKSKRIKWNK